VVGRIELCAQQHALALTITVLAVYFFGDGLRDVLDPRLRL